MSVSLSIVECRSLNLAHASGFSYKDFETYVFSIAKIYESWGIYEAGFIGRISTVGMDMHHQGCAFEVLNEQQRREVLPLAATLRYVVNHPIGYRPGAPGATRDTSGLNTSSTDEQDRIATLLRIARAISVDWLAYCRGLMSPLLSAPIICVTLVWPQT